MRERKVTTLGEPSHASDEELLLTLDGELPEREAAKIRVHVDACGSCRERWERLLATEREFRAHYRSSLDGDSGGGAARAELKDRVAKLAAQPARKAATGAWGALRAGSLRISSMRALALPVAALFLAAITAGLAIHRSGWRATILSDDSSAEPLPITQLTPGDARPVAKGQVCSTEPFTSADNLPAPLKHEVFEEYGLRNVAADHFEVDRLITPDLGGTNDIHNLWPEPSSATVWNAHVKDQLESRLHQMVCDGDLDVNTAQREIAKNWIAAYKKYFNTEQPIS